MIRTIRQCCSGECKESKYCEYRAVRAFQDKQRNTWINIVSSRLFLVGIALIIGFLLGRG